MTYPDGTPVNPGDTVTATLPIKWITDKVYPPQQRTCTVLHVYEKSILVDFPLTFMNSPILQSAYLVAGEFSKVPTPLRSSPVETTAMAQQTITIPLTIIVAAPSLTFVANPTAPPKLTRGVAMQSYSLGTPSGGTPPYSWSIDPNTPVAPGLSVDGNGNLTGTPTTDGTFASSSRTARFEGRR